MNSISKKLKKLIDYLYYLMASPEKYARHIGVTLGKGGFISTKNFSTEPYLIKIGNFVRIAPGTTFYTHGGTWTLRKKYDNPNLDTFGKITVGDYSYIGENCMIMSGVHIGSNCIIGGGSVVTKSVPDGVMVAGNPARFIGYTENFYKKISENHELCCKGLDAESKKLHLSSLCDESFVHKGSVKLPE